MNRTMTAAEIQTNLEEFCPEMYPQVYYEGFGIKVLCRWALSFYVHQCESLVEETECQMLNAIYAHIGKLTVLAQKLKDKQPKGGQ